MSDRTDAKRPNESKDKPAPKTVPSSEAPPVSGPNAPAVGNRDADKTGSNRKGGYGTG